MIKPQLIIIVFMLLSAPPAIAQDTTVVKYWPNGSMRSEWKGTVEHYIFSRVFSNAPANGVTREWYENERLKCITGYHNGQKHGTWEAWHSNGRKWVEQRFELGQPVGTWKIWDEKGEEIASAIFYNGMPSSGTWLIYLHEINQYHKIKVLENNRCRITGKDKNNKKFRRTAKNIDFRWWELRWY